MFLRLLLYISLTSLLFSVACDDTPCSSEFTNEFEIEYFKLVYNETDSETVEQPDIIFTRVFALGNEDSLLVSNEEATTITLSVDPNAPMTTFIIETLDSTTIEDSSIVIFDTLNVSYNRRQRLISEDCGPEQLYVDFVISETTYDSINLFNDQLRTTNNRFIEVFY